MEYKEEEAFITGRWMSEWTGGAVVFNGPAVPASLLYILVSNIFELLYLPTKVHWHSSQCSFCPMTTREQMSSGAKTPDVTIYL
jgi:hypothetical protein